MAIAEMNESGMIVGFGPLGWQGKIRSMVWMVALEMGSGGSDLGAVAMQQYR